VADAAMNTDRAAGAACLPRDRPACTGAGWSVKQSSRGHHWRTEICLLWHRRPMEVYDFPIRAALSDNECNTSRIAKGLAIQHAG
jgi:hypothetical protein